MLTLGLLGLRHLTAKLSQHLIQDVLYSPGLVLTLAVDDHQVQPPFILLGKAGCETTGFDIGLYATLWRKDDPQMTRALAPTVEEALTASVRRNPRPLADALFPIFGPAIRKAIAASLSSMLESLNQTIEHSLSWRALQWRITALRTGKPFAEIVLLNTLVYRVEQVFLIDRESGLLLQHV